MHTQNCSIQAAPPPPLDPECVISPCGQTVELYGISPVMDTKGLQTTLPTVPADLPKELHDYYLSLSAEDKQSLSWMEADLRNSILATRAAHSTGQSAVENAAQNIGKEVHDTILESLDKERTPEQLKIPFAPFPTELTRTTPFFPMSTKERAHREIIEGMVIADHAWGSILFSGPKLSVFDEDSLMVLLAYLNATNNRKETEVGGRKTYLYRGSILSLLKLKGIKRPGKNHYNDLINSFRLLGRAQFELRTNRRNLQGKPAPKTTLISGIISGMSYDSTSQELVLAINPFFAETFAAGNVTLLDLSTRLQLDSQAAKALYRFIQSHRDDQWAGHFLTLAASLNLDIASQPTFKLRSIVNKAIKELIEVGVLSPRSVIKKDLAMIVKASDREPQMLPAKKKPPIKKTRSTPKG